MTRCRLLFRRWLSLCVGLFGSRCLFLGRRWRLLGGGRLLLRRGRLLHCGGGFLLGWGRLLRHSGGLFPGRRCLFPGRRSLDRSGRLRCGDGAHGFRRLRCICRRRGLFLSRFFLCGIRWFACHNEPSFHFIEISSAERLLHEYVPLQGNGKFSLFLIIAKIVTRNKKTLCQKWIFVAQLQKNRHTFTNMPFSPASKGCTACRGAPGRTGNAL